MTPTALRLQLSLVAVVAFSFPLDLFAACDPGHPHTIYVDDDTQGRCACGNTQDTCDGKSWATAHPCVTDALNASCDGDTILVGSGVYDCFVISSRKNLTIQGPPQPPGQPPSATIRWNPSCSEGVVWFSVAHGTDLSWFKIDGSGSPTRAPRGIFLSVDDDNELSNLEIYGALKGIETGGSDTRVFDTYVHDCVEEGISFSGPWQTPDASELRNTRSERNVTGLALHRKGVQVENVTLRDNRSFGAYLGAAADGNTLRNVIIDGGGLPISGPCSQYSIGLYVEGSDNQVLGGEIGHYSLGIKTWGDSSNNIFTEDASVTPARLLDVHHNSAAFLTPTALDPECRLSGAGARLDGKGSGNVIRKARFHHNYPSAIYFGLPSTVVENCEVDNNGSHGLYASGTDGLIRGNRIHHNANYGINLSAVAGSATEPYLVENNDVYGNGVGGMVMAESQHVEFRYNLIHHNGAAGIGFGGDCNPALAGNRIHHNTIYMNGGAQIFMDGAVQDQVDFKDNVIAGKYVIMVSATRTNLNPNALDGNQYFSPDGSITSDTRQFLWNSSLDFCPPTLPDSRCYTFNELRTVGVMQNPACVNGPQPGDQASLMDVRSIWSDPALVDPAISR